MKQVLNLNRLRDKVLTDLASDKLSYYQEIENTIHNEDLSLDIKSDEIIESLKKLALNNIMVAEWNVLTTPQPSTYNPVEKSKTDE